ncbi:CRTAC1 family protein [Tundrisphaera lichenicola]|uniref:CRTAC1 family protein n=1 Tax=Tundrisphaera lichenicola TaxID=2029860 RepID=UPI003EBC7BAD
MTRTLAGSGGSSVRWPAWLILAVLSLSVAGCDALTGGVEFAPAVPVQTQLPPPKPIVKPAIGPWFVDRARDFGIDVVTRCGSPDKPSVLHSLGVGVALFDFDGDGDLDLFVAPGSEVKAGRVICAGGPWLFRNDGPGRWVDVTSRSGLAWTGWAQGVGVADYDADGDLDLIVTQHGPDTLWQNQGDGTFLDVTARAGISGEDWGVAASWGDVDGDGWLDLFVVNYVTVDPIHPPPLHDHIGGVKVFQGPGMLPGQPDQLWRNRGDGTFEEITTSAGLSSPDGKGMSAAFADLDEDGQLDLFVLNDAQANQLYRGSGRGTFRDVALETGAALNRMGAPEGSMGVEIGDVNRDGRLDLIYTNFHHEGTRLLLGGGSVDYTDASVGSRLSIQTEPFVGWGLVLADFDLDGWLDLFQVNGHVYPLTPDSIYAQPPLFLKNLGRETLEFGGRTSVWGPGLDKVRAGRSIASGDVDGDGDLDLVVTTIDGPLAFLINEGNRDFHASAIRLVGNSPNREAIGARVELQAGPGPRQSAVVRRGGGFMGASDPTLHFGLGGASVIEKAIIRWPDGSISEYGELPVDARLVIRQGDPDVHPEPFQRPDPPSSRVP